MDPISATALGTLISGLLKPATDAAGTRMLEALRAMVDRLPGVHRDQAGANLDALEGGDSSVDVPALATVLVAGANEDPTFAQGLRAWMVEADAVVVSDSVSNLNAGTVLGPLVQGRDFSGPMNFK